MGILISEVEANALCRPRRTRKCNGLLWCPTVLGQVFKADNELAVARFVTTLRAMQMATLITRCQFYHQLALQGVISQSEAMAAVQTGTIPSAVQTIINGLSSDQQFGASIKLAGSPTLKITDELMAFIYTGLGWSGSTFNTFWTAASLL